jgi:hypothetical protein
MNEYDVNACLQAFTKLCEEAERSELVSSEDCQYWLFESGYKAAMEEMVAIIHAGKVEKLVLPPTASIIDRLALH